MSLRVNYPIHVAQSPLDVVRTNRNGVTRSIPFYVKSKQQYSISQLYRAGVTMSWCPYCGDGGIRFQMWPLYVNGSQCNNHCYRGKNISGNLLAKWSRDVRRCQNPSCNRLFHSHNKYEYCSRRCQLAAEPSYICEVCGRLEKSHNCLRLPLCTGRRTVDDNSYPFYVETFTFCGPDCAYKKRVSLRTRCTACQSCIFIADAIMEAENKPICGRCASRTSHSQTTPTNTGNNTSHR